MSNLKELLYALWKHDFSILSEPILIWTIYFLAFIILFLENGILPAAFLPGDSLLILIGVLISKGTLNLTTTLLLLTIASSLGSWISYLQGKWLENNRFVKNWLSYIPIHYHQRANRMFKKHGLEAMLTGRFISFVRTLIPIIAGLSGLSSYSFHYFNWISSFLWVLILTLIGLIFGKTSIFYMYEEEFMLCLILFPIILLVIGLIIILIMIWRKSIVHNKNY